MERWLIFGGLLHERPFTHEGKSLVWYIRQCMVVLKMHKTVLLNKWSKHEQVNHNIIKVWNGKSCSCISKYVIRIAADTPTLWVFHFIVSSWVLDENFISTKFIELFWYIYIYIVCIYLETPMFGHPHMFVCPPYVCMTPDRFGYPHMFRHPHMFGCLPYVWMHSHMSECPTHICMPHAPLYICMFLGGIWIWYGDGDIYACHIECSEAITRIIYKKHYKFVHVAKHKYLNNTPYDLYELFICLSEGA